MGEGRGVREWERGGEIESGKFRGRERATDLGRGVGEGVRQSFGEGRRGGKWDDVSVGALVSGSDKSVQGLANRRLQPINTPVLPSRCPDVLMS